MSTLERIRKELHNKLAANEMLGDRGAWLTVQEINAVLDSVERQCER